MPTRGSFGGGVPTGPAGGDLAGSFPNPTVTNTDLSAPLPLTQGGTGSATQNFIDLTTDQNVSGTKTFTNRVIVPAPSGTNDAVSKGYADGISAGVSIKASVAVATNVPLVPANTYSNGTSGVGATLTATAPGVLVIDGYTVLLGDRVLVKNEATTSENGIYTLTTLGTVSVPYVLTRATDLDQGTEFPGAAAFINNGLINVGNGWVIVGAGPYTVGTTSVLFTQFTSPNEMTAGTGIVITGNNVALSVPINPSDLPAATTVAQGAVQLANDLAGTGVLPQVVNTHLASPLPIAQGGTASTTAATARTALGLGTAATDNVSTLASNTAPLGVQSAGSVGQVSDAGHVHAMPSLDQVNVPVANVSMNSHKLTSLSNATVATDAVAFGQLPTTLPPSGSAGGDLAGTYPNPTITGTANVESIIRANRLDQLASPNTALSMNSQKITNTANGTVSTDVATFGQLPTTLPPNGAAGGDLSATYPNPTVSKVNGTTVSGTPVYGRTLTASSGSAASWTVPYFASTGLLSGCVMTLNTSNSFNITAGTGYIVDYVTTPSAPTITPVTINAQTITLGASQTTQVLNWWVADSSGTITSLTAPPSPVQQRTMIRLGVTWSVLSTGAIFNIESAPIILNQPTNSVHGLAFALGTISLSGNVITANGANLNLNKSAGVLHAFGFGYGPNGANNPNIVTSPAETVASFRHMTQLSSSQGASTTTLDVNHWDNGGVLTAISGSTCSIHRVYVMPSGVAGAQLFIQYGQATYSNLANALSGIQSEVVVVNPDMDSYGALIGYILTTAGATALNNSGQATFIPARKFSQV